MTHKLSVTVQIDLDGKNVRIMATGCLTEANQQALPPLIARARTLTPGIRVTVDLSGAEHVEAAGADLLRWAIDHEGPQHGSVELVLPEPSPAHLAAPPARVR
ncbi:hypothetical protein [Kocuria aegyptia]|uniref:STAS domain-containing protein n=1 Tax=Kocuria aegyptia TaxID=330943 RepID=A0ABP4WUT2_9MICC